MLLATILVFGQGNVVTDSTLTQNEFEDRLSGGNGRLQPSVEKKRWDGKNINGRNRFFCFRTSEQQNRAK